MRPCRLILLLALTIVAPSPAFASDTQVFQLPMGAYPHDVAPAPDGNVWYSAQRNGGSASSIPPQARAGGEAWAEIGAAWRDPGRRRRGPGHRRWPERYCSGRPEGEQLGIRRGTSHQTNGGDCHNVSRKSILIPSG